MPKAVAAIVMAAPPKERRRFLLFSSNMALYSAFIQMSEPVSLTDTLVKNSCRGLPSIPRCDAETRLRSPTTDEDKVPDAVVFVDVELTCAGYFTWINSAEPLPVGRLYIPCSVSQYAWK